MKIDFCQSFFVYQLAYANLIVLTNKNFTVSIFVLLTVDKPVKVWYNIDTVKER